MKTHALLAAVLTLTCACAGSTTDRPSPNDEREAAIQRERQDREHEGDHENVRAEAVDDAPDDVPERNTLDADEDADRTADRADRAADRADRAADKNEAAEHKPDNTGRNARDDAPGNLTALDQSNKTSDVDITQAIRKKVVADDALSFNAKNVKIITVSGKVTLRGPVASAAESSTIEKSARDVPGVIQVDNQIEVKR